LGHKDIHRKVKIGCSYLCLKEIDLSFNKLHYLGTVYFKHQEEFEDTKGVIRIRKSEGKTTQMLHNGQRKKDKQTNNDLQTLHIKLKIE